MLEQLNIPPEDAVRIEAERLKRLVSLIFQRLKVPPGDADIAADVLVTADLRGVTTHGVSNYIKHIYVPNLLNGVINPRPNIHTVRETAATALVDGDGGLGHVVGCWAMALAIGKARATGAGMVTVTNSRHFGAAGHYAAMAAQQDMIGIAMTNARPRVVPTFGRDPRLGTNPISIAAPAGEEPDFLLDMATSAVAAGKLFIARLLGHSIPEGWALDADALPTTDPQVGLEATRLVPLGGSREMGSHKGYGLAVAVDILSGVLSGAGFGAILATRHAGHFFGAIDIGAFRPVEEFKAMMDDMIRSVRNTPPAEGHERVYVAGEMEAEATRERSSKGIPLHRDVVDYLEGLAGELEIEYALRG